MRKECICLSQKEYERVMIIKMAVEGFYSNRETAKLLNLSVRQVIRLKNKFKEGGINSLIHGNRGRKPKHALSDELKEKVFKLVMEKYQK